MKTRLAIFIAFMLCALSSPTYAQVIVHTTDVRCSGLKNGKAMLTISNAPGPYKIDWFKGTQPLPQYKDKLNAGALGPGSYKVEIHDKNDCMIEREFVIEEPPGISINITSTTGSFDYCGSKNFPDVHLIATSSGGTPPMNCDDPVCVKKVTAPGEYSFTVVDSKGCQEKKSIRVNWIGIVCASDPNDITGPVGYSTPKWVAASQPMEYTIRFENDPEFATAPAQFVYVEYIFDPKINPFSLRLGNFGFGDQLYTLPFTSTYYQQRINLQNEIGLWVDVVAGIDINNNKAFWSFQAIDPSTGLPPIDPQQGFLPVNDSLIGNGEGFVTFTVTPKVSAVTGDIVSAKADIIFDVNEAITTNTWTNKLDALAPVSLLNETDTLVENTDILLNWQGEDDPGGCGIRDYALYYQTHGGPFVLYGEGIPDTFILFEGDPGTTYGFYIIATDHVGNKELKVIAEQTVRIKARDLIEIITPQADPVCFGDSLIIHWRTINVDSVRISMSIDSGETFFTIAPLKLPDDSLISILLVDSLLTDYAQLLFASLEDTVYEVKSVFFQVKPLPQVAISGTSSICDNEVASLFASGANFYIWTPDLFLDDATSANPRAYIHAPMTYFLSGTDVFGCTNIDSISISIHPTYLDTVLHEMCNEDSVFVGGTYQTIPGFYTDSLASSTGCDSTVITEVILNGPCPFPSPQVYVDLDATGLNNGTSWANAFNDLQDALAEVEYRLNVREIWIAEGAYYPSDSVDRNASFVLRDSVIIYGGFVGIEIDLEDRLADNTLVKISGDIGTPNDSTDNVYHVVTIDSTCTNCVLDGLTVTYGQADGLSGDSPIGAGLFVKGKALLDGLIIERNMALQEGAAIYNTGANAILTIRDCLFKLNTSGLEKDILNSNGAELRFEGANNVQD